MNIKPQKHIINILKSTERHHPNFTLFLGAGASVTSGVDNAMTLIKQWREAYIDMHGEEDLKSQHWYLKDNEYSELFESLYDQPSQRREFIETCIESASPSWGYIYLVNLLRNKNFNTIFTTNFDDLLNESCYSFSKDLRPIVSAHDSSIKNVRLTSHRPKIIKLHGDFLFDNIKNTVRELESLEDNMRSKFKQYASEFGMIVVGYAGNDRSIMDTLNTLLHTETNFPHGIYWCIRKDSIISGEVKNLTRFTRFHLIEIEGFDEFFAEINSALNIELQKEVSDPYNSLANKLDNFVTNINEDGEHNLVIQEDINNLSEHIQHINSAIELIKKMKVTLSSINLDSTKEQLLDVIQQLTSDTEIIKNDNGDILAISTPKALLASATYREENYKESLNFSLEALVNKVLIDTISIAIKSMAHLNDFSSLSIINTYLHDLIKIPSKDLSILISTIVDLLQFKRFQEVKDLIKIIESKQYNDDRLQSYLDLNLSLAYKLNGEAITSKLSNAINEHRQVSISEKDHWLYFGLSVLLEDELSALECAENFTEVQFSNILPREMPIMSLISDGFYAKLSSLAQGKGFCFETIDADELIQDNKEMPIDT
jgi:NAD-dependent SIR2 family protein deacetylase